MMSTVSSVSQTEHRQTLTKHRSRVLTVMSAMRAEGYGFEDIHVTLNAMGFAISRDACRKFVIPKSTAPAQAGALSGR